MDYDGRARQQSRDILFKPVTNIFAAAKYYNTTSYIRLKQKRANNLN